MKRIIFLSVMLAVTSVLFGQTHDFDNEGIIFAHGNNDNRITIGNASLQAGYAGTTESVLEVTSTTGSYFRLGGSSSELFFIADDNIGHRITTPQNFPLRINNVMRVDRDYATFNTTYIPTDYVIAVGGDIIAEGVRVELETNWPDYVFTSTYNLMPLAQVEQFIEENGHLPNVPSAQTMEEEGIDLGDIVTKQMEKIEELTLYIIELQKEVEILKAQK